MFDQSILEGANAAPIGRLSMVSVAQSEDTDNVSRSTSATDPQTKLRSDMRGSSLASKRVTAADVRLEDFDIQL